MMTTVRVCLTASVMIAVVVGTASASTKATPAQICASVKMRAAAAKAKKKIACYATATKRGIAVDPECLLKAETVFLTKFQKAEAKGGCITLNDAGSIEQIVDEFVAAIVAALPSAAPTATPSETATATISPVPTATPSDTRPPTQTPSNTALPTRTPTATSPPTRTPTNSPLPTQTPTMTIRPSNTPTNTALPSATPTATPTDVPTATATPTASFKLVFVSSTVVQGNFGGLTAADAFCQGLAARAGLSGSYKAWLSDRVTSAADRLSQSPVPYQLLSSAVVANNWRDLTDGTLAAAIDVDETGRTLGVTVFVLTATDEFGAATADNCQNWTSAATTDFGTFGLSSSRAFDWTRRGPGTCDQDYHLYCLEQ